MNIEWEDIKDYDIKFKVSDLKMEVTLTVRALTDKAFRNLVEAAETIEKEIKEAEKA